MINYLKFFCFCYIFLFFSCKTQQIIKKIDYSDSLSVLCEVDKVKLKLEEKRVLEALYIAKNLNTHRKDIKEVVLIYEKAFEDAKNALYESVNKKDWKKAKILFNSIKVCEPSFDKISFNMIKEKIEKPLYEKHPILLNLKEKTQNSAKFAKTIDEMINATVTVFVDKGIKVEKGLGYSDIILGSGFFIDEDGYIITNYHVIQSEVEPEYEGYSKLYIKNFNGSKDKILAKVIGYDPLLDLALLKAEVKPSYIFKLGSSEKLKVGHKIYAIGSPLGLERTITAGIVSSKNRQLLSLVEVIQLDAAINHGSSGGPIVDEMGEVQAIVFAGVTRTQGLNFAIPIEVLKMILPSLYSGGENTHGWLSCYGKDIDNFEEIPLTNGIIASYVMPSGTLSNAGFNDDAIITHINDIQIKNISTLKKLLFDLDVSSIIKLRGKIKIDNNWVEDEFYSLLQERPYMPASVIYKKDTIKRCVLPFYGLNLEYSGSRRYYRIKDVIPNSYGDEAGFAPNDYLEIRYMKIDEKEGIVRTLFYAKKLKSAYIESFIGASTYGDNSGYF